MSPCALPFGPRQARNARGTPSSPLRADAFFHWQITAIARLPLARHTRNAGLNGEQSEDRPRPRERWTATLLEIETGTYAIR